MTTGQTPKAPDFLTPDEIAQDIDAQQWQTVSDEDVAETKVTFDNWNEQFIGTFLGSRVIDTAEGKLVQFRFKHDDFYYFINGSWSLTQGMHKVRPGQVTRITYVSDRDTGQQSPMKVFRVDVQRAGGNVRTARATVPPA